MINTNYQKIQIISDFCLKAFSSGKVMTTENGVFVATNYVDSHALEYLLNDLYCYYMPTNYKDGIRKTNFVPKLVKLEGVESCSMINRVKDIKQGGKSDKFRILEALDNHFHNRSESDYFPELRQDLIRFEDQLVFARKNNEHTISVSFKNKPHFRTNVGELTILWLPDFDLDSLQIKASQTQRGEHRLWKPTPLQNVWYDIP